MQRTYLLASLVFSLMLMLSLSQSVGAVNYTYSTRGYYSCNYNDLTCLGYTANLSGTCQVVMGGTDSFSGSAFIISSLYKSPDTNTVMTFGANNRYSESCASDGLSSPKPTSKVSGNYLESSIGMTTSATGGYYTGFTEYSCNSNSEWQNFSMMSDVKDSRGKCFWQEHFFPGTAPSLTNYNDGCSDLTAYKKSIDCNSDVDVAETNGVRSAIYPFNSGSGTLYYNISNFTFNYTLLTFIYGQEYKVSMLNLNTGAEITLRDDTSTTHYGQTIMNDTSGFLTGLEQNAPYLLIVSLQHSGGQIGVIHYPDLELDINIRQGEYVCGECIDNSQLCVDQTHQFPDRSQPCGFLPEKSVFLGFDQYHPVKSILCTETSISGSVTIFPVLTFPPLYIPPCSRFPAYKDRNFPNGWSVVTTIVNSSYYGLSNPANLEDYADMDFSSYYAPDAGTPETSLKLWYIPPKASLPYFNNTGLNEIGCNSTIQGKIPQVFRNDINQTFWISKNITALSPFMKLSYRAITCGSSELIQGGTFGCSILGAQPTDCQNGTGFAQDWYTNNGCPQVPLSSITVTVTDLDTSTISLGHSRDVTTSNWDLGYVEDNINNMTFNHTYEVRFGILPKYGVTDVSPYCVRIDDVNVLFRSVQFNCTNGCFNESNPTTGIFGDYDGDGIVDYTYVTSTPFTATSCNVQFNKFDPKCVPAAQFQEATDISQCKINTTCSGTTLITKDCANTQTITFTPNNAYCISLQGVQAGNTNPLAPTTNPNILINGLIAILTTPAVLSLLFGVLISALVTGRISKYTEGALGGTTHGAGAVFVLSFLAFLTAFTVAGWFPLWLYVVLGLLAAAILARVVGFI